MSAPVATGQVRLAYWMSLPDLLRRVKFTPPKQRRTTTYIFQGKAHTFWKIAVTDDADVIVIPPEYHAEIDTWPEHMKRDVQTIDDGLKYLGHGRTTT